MKTTNIIIYDLEILRAIPDRNGRRDEGIEYCEGWHDHANMGITVLGVFDYAEDRYRVFCLDNNQEFTNLVSERRPLCVGFNNIRFDNAVLSATHGWHPPPRRNAMTCYARYGPRPAWVLRSPGHLMRVSASMLFASAILDSAKVATALWHRCNGSAVISVRSSTTA
jgi:hypothetical protein